MCKIMMSTAVVMFVLFCNNVSVILAEFHDNDDGTVIDTATGLIWQKCSMGQTWDDSNGCSGSVAIYTWQAAQLACRHSSWAGYDNWRLPEQNELQSIVDGGRYDPAIDQTFFPNTLSSCYWSSSLYSYIDNYAWLINFYNGDDSYVSRISNNFYVRAVRSDDPCAVIGDLDCDDDVDGSDLRNFTEVYADGYDPACDFNKDGYLNELDVAIFAMWFEID